MSVQQTADFSRALARHLGKVQGLAGCQALARHEGGDWHELARIGRVPREGLEQKLAGFDPDAGGTVEPLAGDKGGWQAAYACAGPTTELYVVLVLADMPPAELQAILSDVERSIGWLLVEAEKLVSRSARDAVLSTEVGAEALIGAAEAPTRAMLADQWIALLERTLVPEMIGVCWVRDYAPRLAAISGGGLVSQPSQQRSAFETLSSAAIAARSALVLDAGTAAPAEADAMRVLTAARALVMPVYDGDPCRAAVVVLWSKLAAELPDQEASDLIARVLGEALTIQRRAYPSFLVQAGHWLAGLGRAVFGKRAGKLKLALAAIAIVLVAAALIPTNHRPAFNARIEARDRLVVAAPFDGFLAAAPVELGDSVVAGTPLIRMEDSDLRLEHSRLAAEAEQLAAAARNARAERNVADVRNFEAQLRANQVEAALVDDQLARANVVAGEAGLVVSGDASKRLGSRVRLGEPLLEIATDESLAVKALVDEDWVSDLPEHASATLLLAAWPDHAIPMHIARITSETEQSDGANTFVTWLDFDRDPGIKLMDGMRGIVRIDAGPTTMLGRYGRGIGRWFQRSFWRWS